MNDEDRINKLQSKQAFHERTVDELSKSVYEFQLRLDRLESACCELGEQVRALSEKLPGDLPADGKPPHY